MKKTEEKTALTCPNESCSKVFSKPLITVNLQKSSKASYNACPYCLTEIPSTEIESENSQQETTDEIELPEEKPTQKQEEESFVCKHYHGYLNEKSLKQQIPDECILCVKVIDCMLSKNT